jgi:hypothetical protein
LVAVQVLVMQLLGLLINSANASSTVPCLVTVTTSWLLLLAEHHLWWSGGGRTAARQVLHEQRLGALLCESAGHAHAACID